MKLNRKNKKNALQFAKTHFSMVQEKYTKFSEYLKKVYTDKEQELKEDKNIIQKQKN